MLGLLKDLAKRPRRNWVVVVSDGSGATHIYGPHTRGAALRIAAARNQFVQTLGFSTAMPMTPGGNPT